MAQERRILGAAAEKRHHGRAHPSSCSVNKTGIGCTLMARFCIIFKLPGKALIPEEVRVDLDFGTPRIYALSIADDKRGKPSQPTRSGRANPLAPKRSLT